MTTVARWQCLRRFILLSNSEGGARFRLFATGPAQAYCADAIECDQLPGCDFLVVFLGNSSLAGITGSLSGPGRLSLENSADGQDRLAADTRPYRVVLSAERDVDALAFHVECELG